MKSLAILGVGERNSTSQSFKNDLDSDCYSFNSVYYKISQQKLEVGVISKDNLSYLECNNFKFITYWENSQPHLSAILAEYCVQNNIVMLNREFTIKNHALINDKFFQSKFFRANGIPFLTITNTHQDSYIVFKSRHGSCGENMHLINKSLKFLDKKICIQTHIVQEFLKYDGDYRAIVLGGKCIGIIERCPQEGDFRANVSRGATVKRVDANYAKDIELFAEETVRILGADYVGVDILRRGSEFYILEVNFYAHFAGFESIHGKDYVFDKIKNFLTIKAEK